MFDAHARTNGAPATYEESSFEFLNRVSGTFWEHPRSLIEEWASHLAGDDDYADLRARLRSGDDRQYNSAFLELYLHEVLLRTGHSVTLHPTLPHTTRRPDFYAERDGVGFYLEAVVPTWTNAQDAQRSRRNRFFDVVNRLESPNFILMIRSLTEGMSNPAAARLRTELRKWLAGLDPDSIHDLDVAPRYSWKQDDWAAEFSAIPKKKEARGKADGARRAIGVYAHEPARGVDDARRIRRALASKDGEYGNLGKPFVIAVGLFVHDRDYWHSMNAFYGHETGEWSEGVSELRVFRSMDGYFGSSADSRHTNVSSVILVNQLQPYHVPKAEVSIWRHPHAERPTPASLHVPGDIVEVVENRISVTPTTIEPGAFFGLPNPWPPGEPWPQT
ncbi:hypothetical protein [Microbacterium binotii]|uniref:hypothetical protein n=1 Tax=Microbacterium binotii TaxID=462710 RepID=UPI001F436746|nr:hypothetical protein [Microbacterium binotii]UIN31312.1 hypothetical protein LXM64_03655 [Microbacterium binotii]